MSVPLDLSGVEGVSKRNLVFASILVLRDEGDLASLL